MFSVRRYSVLTIISIAFFILCFHPFDDGTQQDRRHGQPRQTPHKHHKPRPVDQIIHPGFFKPKFRWRNVKEKHPVDKYTPLPSGKLAKIPRVQHDFPPEGTAHAIERRKRLAAVEEAFKHSWDGYRHNAWLQDEVTPITGKSRNAFGGWGATLVDSLDTLWIMGMKNEFEAAVKGVKKIEFLPHRATDVNVFETTIRYLGGLMSAYDVSGHKYKVLLHKAIELGEMLFHAFDTPNRMPITRWDWEKTVLGKDQVAQSSSLLAEVGSLTLEFTRLSQLTGDPKYYDAVARITDGLAEQQYKTKVPGLWPLFVDAKNMNYMRSNDFSIGGMADSLYEYLPKEHLLLGGRTDQYRNMFQAALTTAKEHIFFRVLNPKNRRMLVPGFLRRTSKRKTKLSPEGEHLGCFAGGMVALASKVFQQADDMETARELVDGCVWAYESMASGIMPEAFAALPCENPGNENCTWNEDAWHRAVARRAYPRMLPEEYAERAREIIAKKSLAPGFVDITDARYILRPEAIESVFILYRITGESQFQDTAWKMFQSITKHTKTKIAYAALKDVTKSEPELVDNMESFWTAETLKYFYLIFSEPDVISLDDYVLNTEAHPLLRPI